MKISTKDKIYFNKVNMTNFKIINKSINIIKLNFYNQKKDKLQNFKNQEFTKIKNYNNN